MTYLDSSYHKAGVFKMLLVEYFIGHRVGTAMYARDLGGDSAQL